MKLQGKTKQELVRARLSILRDVIEADKNGGLYELIDLYSSQVPYGNETAFEYLRLISTVLSQWIFIGFNEKENVEYITIPLSATKDEVLEVTNSFGKCYKTKIYVEPL